VITGKRALILGSGTYGRLIGAELLKSPVFQSMYVAARTFEKASRLAANLNAISVKPVSAVKLDATDFASVCSEARKVDIIVNVTHPMAATVVPAARAAMECGLPYIDINIDIPSTREVMALDGDAKSAGVTMIPGCGYDPGLINMLAFHASRGMDTVEEVHFAGAEQFAVALCPKEAIDAILDIFGVPFIYRDGRYVDVAPGSGTEEVEMPGLDSKLEIMAAQHTPLVTIPRAFGGVRLVTYKMGMSPIATGNDIWRRILEWGLNSKEKVDVKGVKVAPCDFIAAFFASPSHARAIRPNLKFWSVRRVLVKGTIGGANLIRSYACHDPKVVATERTCALAAEMLVSGVISQKGVVIPENIDAEPFLRQALGWGMVIQETEELVR
jgi:saccharopine dehydrogenase-like NADP-dependent oxidoreductase